MSSSGWRIRITAAQRSTEKHRADTPSNAEDQRLAKDLQMNPLRVLRVRGKFLILLFYTTHYHSGVFWARRHAWDVFWFWLGWSYLFQGLEGHSQKIFFTIPCCYGWQLYTFSNLCTFYLERCIASTTFLSISIFFRFHISRWKLRIRRYHLKV